MHPVDQKGPLRAMTVEEINQMTARARALPPSGDQEHVLVADGEDPWVISHQGSYYYCTVDRPKRQILVSRFDGLEEMSSAPLLPIWPGTATNIPSYVEIWAPELQYLDGKFYIYFALYDGNGGAERIHVIESLSSDPQGSYAYKGRLEATTDRWSIDGTVAEMPNGRRYFLWSGWDGFENHAQNIYIGEMANPWTLRSDRTLLSTPEYAWEKSGYPYINEGPQALYHDGRVFIIYSASGSWTDDYCLGQLTYLGGDPLDPHAWRKEPQPVFQKTDTIFGTGHCCFVKGKKGEDILVYHASRSSGAGWARQVRYKPFGWKADGSPDFGLPI